MPILHDEDLAFARLTTKEPTPDDFQVSAPGLLFTVASTNVGFIVELLVAQSDSNLGHEHEQEHK